MQNQKPTTIFLIKFLENPIEMKKKQETNNNKSNIFARIRSHHYGESQSFTTIEAAISWVQQASRELVEAGYTSVTYTIQGECHGNQYQGQANNNPYNNSIEAEPITHNSKIDSFNIKENKDKMEVKRNNPATDFFSLSESEVRTIAAATMDAATHGKELTDREFIDAIADASNGWISLHRSAKNADRVDFHDWEAYTKTHAPRDPGKKPLNAIEQTIIDTYRRGRSGTSDNVDSAASYRSQNTHIYQDNSTVGVLIQNIISTILVHITKDETVRHYLRCYSSGLDAELSLLTEGVITCSITDNNITLGSITGITSSIATEDRPLPEIEAEVRAILIRMLIQAALSAKTRDTVARIINLEELGDMVYRL